MKLTYKDIDGHFVNDWYIWEKMMEFPPMNEIEDNLTGQIFNGIRFPLTMRVGNCRDNIWEKEVFYQVNFVDV